MRQFQGADRFESSPDSIAHHGSSDTPCGDEPKSDATRLIAWKQVDNGVLADDPAAAANNIPVVLRPDKTVDTGQHR